MIGTAIGISVVRFFVGFRSSEELSAGGHAVRLLVTFAAVFVFALIVTAIIAAIQSATLPAKFRKLVPAGAPMSAEFAPTWAGLQAGTINERVEHSAIIGVRMVNDMLLVFVKGAKKPVIFPGELLPSHIADEYLARFSFAAIAAAKKN